MAPVSTGSRRGATPGPAMLIGRRTAPNSSSNRTGRSATVATHWVVGADGRGLRNLTKDAAVPHSLFEGFYDPVWSPDGRLILLGHERFSEDEVFTAGLATDTSGRHRPPIREGRRQLRAPTRLGPSEFSLNRSAMGTGRLLATPFLCAAADVVSETLRALSGRSMAWHGLALEQALQ